MGSVDGNAYQDVAGGDDLEDALLLPADQGRLQLHFNEVALGFIRSGRLDAILPVDELRSGDPMTLAEIGGC